MTIRQFQELSSLNKKSVVRHKGVYLLIHKEADVDVVLYQIENFYVEVFFSTGNPMEIRFRAPRRSLRPMVILMLFPEGITFS